MVRRLCWCLASLVAALGCAAGCGPAALPREVDKPPAQPALDADGTRKAPKATYPQSDQPEIRLRDDGAVEVVGLALKDLQALKDAGFTAEQWNAVFAVYVARADGKAPSEPIALLGTYRVADDALRFEPRYPLVRGQAYRAVFTPARVPGREKSREKPSEAALLLPKPKTTPTVVEQVYPTRDDLPENQLRFYVHFSGPMSRGEAYEHVRLLKADGKPVGQPFLQIEQELWDGDTKRLTLLCDPGRVKRGLKPREEDGPILEEGGTYTLVIDRKWDDAHGEPLQEGFRKTFRILAPDDTQPDPKKWKLEPPPANGRRPLTVALGKSLDNALLHRMVWVTDADGRKVEGTVAVSEKETRWRFEPKEAWRPGAYFLVADTRLEDPCGNSINRPFEVDEFRPVQRAIKSETVKVPFEVK